MKSCGRNYTASCLYSASLSDKINKKGEVDVSFSEYRNLYKNYVPPPLFFFFKYFDLRSEVRKKCKLCDKIFSDCQTRQMAKWRVNRRFGSRPCRLRHQGCNSDPSLSHDVQYLHKPLVIVARKRYLVGGV
jgi:hypothetical protein